MSLNNPADMSQSDMRPSRVWHVTKPTCATCKHWGKDAASDRVEYCQNINLYYMIDEGDARRFETPADFGCNQWESK